MTEDTYGYRLYRNGQFCRLECGLASCALARDEAQEALDDRRTGYTHAEVTRNGTIIGVIPKDGVPLK